eukprot:g24958.t1
MLTITPISASCGETTEGHHFVDKANRLPRPLSLSSVLGSLKVGRTSARSGAAGIMALVAHDDNQAEESLELQ